MSDPFRITLARQPTFHGKVSTDRADRGFDNYLILAGAGYQLRILLNGKEHLAVTADPVVGIFSSSFPLEANPSSISEAARVDLEEFVKRYRAKYNAVPAVQESLGFVVGIGLIRDVIGKSASLSAADLREAALKADVPTGSYINGWGMKFDEKGQNQRAFGSVVQWQDLRMVPVYPMVSKLKEPIMVPLPDWSAR